LLHFVRAPPVPGDGVMPILLEGLQRFELIAVITATSAGNAKHINPTQRYNTAAAAHPTANQAIPRIVRPKRALTAVRSHPSSSLHKSTASRTACVVLPVMIVVGGIEAKWTR
jgi:hypothetical protein